MPSPWIILVVALMAGGCVRAGPEGVVRPVPDARIEVDNRNFQDVTLYVIRGGERRRLGRVSGVGTAVFTIAGDLLRGGRTLRFIADPIGSRHLALDEQYHVFPGDVVVLVIPPS